MDLIVLKYLLFKLSTLFCNSPWLTLEKIHPRMTLAKKRTMAIVNGSLFLNLKLHRFMLTSKTLFQVLTMNYMLGLLETDYKFFLALYARIAEIVLAS